jgi:peptidoglycan/xylan/chitin deacetylase (PgdA/CDA1 family)
VAARIIEAPPGAIILAHDIHETTVDAVPAIIVALKNRGIHFVTVTKLFEPQELLPGYVYSQQPDAP